MKRSILHLTTAACGLSLAVSATAQQTSFADIANGTVAPASIKLAELTPDFKAMHLHSVGEASQGMMGGLGGIMMMAGMSGGGQGANKMMPAFFQLGALGDFVWTKGQTVNLGGHEFLVTYKLNTGFDPSAINGPTPKLAANLTLSLVRTDTVISVAPDPTMTPDQLRKTLTSAGAAFDTAPIHMEVGQDEAIQAAILFPVFAQARIAAQETATLSNAKQIALAALIYSNDYDDQFPYVQSTDQFRRVTKPYYKDDSIWKSNNPNGGGFRFAMNLAGVSASAIDNPSEAPLVYEANAWPDGRRMVAFADGHAKKVTQLQWAAIEPFLQKKYPRSAKSPIKIGSAS